ncbi:TetR/AcrR family transcriptional regulator [Enterococcus sp. LJL128]|uniref:TetR/AcrR family transcriptional regulator n=1 Tax=Enterococcus sp. LJL51 TaxID=3416656 RepID=UPI003CEB3F39
MNGFEKRRKQKEESILKTALHLFLSEGLKNTSVQIISKQAGVSPVTIFNYFNSKENLITQTCFLYLNTMYEDFFHMVHSDKGFEEKMHFLIFTKNQVSKEIHPEFYEALMAEYSKPNNPAMKDFLKKGTDLYLLLFEQGKREGMISKDLSVPALMLYMQLLTTSMQDQGIYNKILPYTDEIMDMFLYGIYGKR